MDPERLTETLERMIRDNEAYVVAERTDRAEREMNQSIREEQDRAFQETLRQDQGRRRATVGPTDWIVEAAVGHLDCSIQHFLFYTKKRNTFLSFVLA